MGIGKQTVLKIVYEVSESINTVLHEQYLPAPDHSHWLQNEREFALKGFPRAVGCVDGKHFRIKVPNLFYHKNILEQIFSAQFEAVQCFLTTRISILL